MRMELPILVILILVIIALVLKAKKTSLHKNDSSTQSFSYEPAGPLFSAAERSFYGVLTLAAAENAVVFGKVRIADILKPQRQPTRKEWQQAFNKISAKHFDYVLCRPDDLSIISVIELDDKSHELKKQVVRDQFVEEACKSAGIQLHRFKASNSYTVSEVKERLFPSLEPEIKVTHAIKKKQFCPKCSAELVLRVVAKGKNEGKQFLACSAFPKCRYTVF
jgi:uncharacterized small protein (DUF1192 family)